MRPFDEQASFTFAVTAGSRLNLEGNILGITAGPIMPTLGINARGDDLENIDNPPDLIFTVVFEKPSAAIRPQAGAAPLFDYYSELGATRTLFAFVGEENQLALAVTLDEDSTFLADSASILRALPLAVATFVGENNTVTLVAASSGDPAGDLPPRDLLFKVVQPQTNVAVNVSVEMQSEQVGVAPLNFVAHLLRLEHEADVTIEQEQERILLFSLEDELINGAPGLNPGSNWTLGVANRLQLAENGYAVEEVVPGTRTTRVFDIFTQFTATIEVNATETAQVRRYTREMRTLVLDGEVVLSDTRTMPETLSADLVPTPTLALFTPQLRTVTLVVSATAERAYFPADVAHRQGNVEIAPGTRTLRLRRTGAATDPAPASRLVLTFEYRPAAGPAGSFNRVVDIGGVIPALNAGIFVAGSDTALDGDAVLSRGRSVVLDLVVSNLLEGEEPLPENIAINHPPGRGLVVEPQEGTLDAINRRYVLPLRVSLAQDAAGPDYLVSINVRLAGRGRVAAASFRVDVNDPPQSDGPTLLEVDESGPGNAMQFLLRVFDPDGVDPDGRLKQLDADDLRLEVVGFADIATFPVDGASEEGVPYFDLEFSAIEFQDGGEGYDNALSMTLTLTGKLATPFGAVVELRLFGATDGEEVLDQRLSVMIADVAPTFDLGTATVELRGGVESVVPLLGFTDGAAVAPGAPVVAPVEVLVLEAPPHLVVRFDDTTDPARVTVMDLNPVNNTDPTPVRVRLAAFDSQGGRVEVVLQVDPLPQLPLIEAPHPLLVVAEQTPTVVVRRVGFVETPIAAEVTWTVDEDGVPEGVTVRLLPVDAGGNVGVAVTASLAVGAGMEFNLELTATDDFGQQRTVELPVAVVAADPEPRLNLSVKGASDEAGADRETISSFVVTDTLFLFVEAAPDGVGLDPLTATIRIESLATDPGTLIWQTTTVRAAAAQPISVLLPPSALTALVADDLLQVSITILAATGAVAQDSLRFRVAARETTVDAVSDGDNDGLPDAQADGENAEADLGPTLSAAVASATDAGTLVRRDLQPSLSLGDRARSVGLGDCGLVSLALTLGAGGIDRLTGCEGIDVVAGFPSSAEIEAALRAGNFAAGDYRLFDLRVTFDSVAAGEDELVLLSLPAHPSPNQFYRVHRFDGTELVPALSAALPAAMSAAPAILARVDDCQTCLYAVDGDRDGSVELLLLLESVARTEFSSVYQTRITPLLAAVGDQAPTLTIPLADLFAPALLGDIMTPMLLVSQADGGANISGGLALTDRGEPALRLTGLRHSPRGAKEVQVQLYSEVARGIPVATLTLQVSVPNRPPVVTFLLNGVETDTLKLAPSATETAVLVRLVNPDGGPGFFSLQLITERRPRHRPVRPAGAVPGGALSLSPVLQSTWSSTACCWLRIGPVRPSP